MTREAFTPSLVGVINGVGPYAVAHPYREGALQLLAVAADGTISSLSSSAFTANPVSSATDGAITLTGAAAAAYDGQSLYIQRLTYVEQGFDGETAREEGMEDQFDWLTEAVQDVLLRITRTIQSLDVNFTGAIAVGTEGAALVFGPGGTSLVPGPTAADITEAQANAVAAAAAASAAAASAGEADAAVAGLDILSVLAETTGSSTAYVLTTGLSLSDVPAGAPFQVRFHAQCGDDPTLDVDGTGAVALLHYRRDGDVPNNVKAGQIQRDATLWLREIAGSYLVLGGEGFRSQENAECVYKAADESRSQTTAAAADGTLSLVVQQPGKYALEAVLIHSAGAGAFKFRLPTPAGGSLAYTVDDDKALRDGATNDVDADTSGSDRVTRISGTVDIVSSAGVSLSWAQNVSNAADTIVKTGSFLKLTWIGA